MKFLPMALGALVLLAVAAGCKPTEQNYREAYLAAKEKQQADSLDGDIESRLMIQGRPSAVVASDGDTLFYHTVTIGYPDGGGASRESVRRYNVVVGQFKQIFNAKAMRMRLIASGYDSAMVLNTREPYYYVVAATCATPDSALRALRRVSSDPSLTLRPPFPWVLRPSHIR